MKVKILLFSFVAYRCECKCAESRTRIMRKVTCQCISNVTMRRDISITDRQMMNSLPGFFFLDFADPIPYRCNSCVRIHLGEIIYPRCFLIVSLNPTNVIGIQITL